MEEREVVFEGKRLATIRVCGSRPADVATAAAAVEACFLNIGKSQTGNVRLWNVCRALSNAVRGMKDVEDYGLENEIRIFYEREFGGLQRLKALAREAGL
jgi:hypothetical protein